MAQKQIATTNFFRNVFFLNCAIYEYFYSAVEHEQTQIEKYLTIKTKATILIKIYPG